MATNAAEFLEYSANLPAEEVDESCDKPEGEVEPSNNLNDQPSSPSKTSDAGLKIEEYQPPPMPRNIFFVIFTLQYFFPVAFTFLRYNYILEITFAMVNFGLPYQYRYQPSPYLQPYQYPLPISIFRGESEMKLTCLHFSLSIFFCPDSSYHYYDVWRKCSRFVADDPHNPWQQAGVHKKLDHLNLQVLKAINIRKTGQDIENGKAT